MPDSRGNPGLLLGFDVGASGRGLLPGGVATEIAADMLIGATLAKNGGGGVSTFFIDDAATPAYAYPTALGAAGAVLARIPIPTPKNATDTTSGTRYTISNPVIEYYRGNAADIVEVRLKVRSGTTGAVATLQTITATELSVTATTTVYTGSFSETVNDSSFYYWEITLKADAASVATDARLGRFRYTLTRFQVV